MPNKLITALLVAGITATVTLPARAATTDTNTGGLTYEKLIKSALGDNAGVAGGLMELLGISGSTSGDLASILKGGAFFQNDATTASATQTKAVSSIGRLLGIRNLDVALSGAVLGDENTSKVLLAASKAAQGGDLKKSASTILSVLNSTAQTEQKAAAEKTATDGAVPLAASVEGANQAIIQATDFVDAVESAPPPESTLDATITANKIAAEDVRVKAASAGVQAAALSQGKEANLRLAAIAGFQEEQNKRQQAEDYVNDANRAVANENSLRSRNAVTALTTGSYHNSNYFKF